MSKEKVDIIIGSLIFIVLMIFYFSGVYIGTKIEDRKMENVIGSNIPIDNRPRNILEISMEELDETN